MMRTIITIGTAFIITIVGAAFIGMHLTDKIPLWLAFLVSGVVGVFTGVRLGSALSYRPRRSTTAKPRPRQVVTSFSDRLERFTGGKSTWDDGESEYKSNLPFWMANLTFKRVPARSSADLRRLLNRIRAILGRTA